MKRIISIALLLVMIVNLAPFALASEASVIEISTKEQLNNIRNNLSGSYKLVADIEFTDADFAEGGAFYNDGKGFDPIGSYLKILDGNNSEMSANPFTGTLNGNGHVIKGLKINIPSEDGYSYVGLFGINNGIIENLGLENCTITAGFVQDAGAAFQSVDIGAFAAYNLGTIRKCYSTTPITVTVNGDVKAQIGGIAGSSSGIIQYCYNTGNITGTSNSTYWVVCGGIAGYTRSSATEDSCYNIGTVSSATAGNQNNHMGGIVGYNYSTITKCYYLGAEKAVGREANNTAQTATKLSAESAKKQETYTDFDFNATWKMEATSTPLLKVFQHTHVEDTSTVIPDVKATCKQPGVGHTACITCGITMTTGIPIAINPDNHVEKTTITVDTPANCKQPGKGHYECSLCGKTTRSNITIPVNDQHAAGDWQVKAYPKFSVGGTEVKCCIRCGKEMDSRTTAKLAALPDMTNPKAWYYGAVEYVVGRKIMSGSQKGNTVYFAPDDNTTRAQVVLVLANIAGVDTSKYADGNFTDVKKGSWYAGAVNWAAKNGITAGTTPTTFAPNDKVTREQFASFLFRFAKKQYGKDMPKLEGMINFTDAAKISSWAKESVTACVRADIINGMENTNKKGTFRFEPKGDATRAQLAVMIRQFMENVIK